MHLNLSRVFSGASGVCFTEDWVEEGGLSYLSYPLPETNIAKRDFFVVNGSDLTNSFTTVKRHCIQVKH